MASAVHVTDLGIQFWINRKRNMRLREFLIRGESTGPKGTFWALRNVSFEVGPGEALGLVGANGSGKSTLLKLIAGVLIPDEGTVEVSGPVAPLLELSAGFAPDLSARQNIRLNGIIHGLSHEEIDERFDAIVEFAKVDRFLGMPLRHFSSGMKVRLGFAIAVNLDHPILLIDEVLAVGDKAFRRKCYSAMEDVLVQGRTLIVVSHRDADIKRFCERAIYLRDGEMVSDGPVSDVLGQYTAESEGAG